MANNIPKFANMSTNELITWYEKHRYHNAELAREIFPHRQSGYVSVMVNLADYANCLALARLEADKGNHERAKEYFESSERIADRLPIWASVHSEPDNEKAAPNWIVEIVHNIIATINANSEATNGQCNDKYELVLVEAQPRAFDTVKSNNESWGQVIFATITNVQSQLTKKYKVVFNFTTGKVYLSHDGDRFGFTYDIVICRTNDPFII